MDPKEEEARARYRYLQLKSKAAAAPVAKAALPDILTNDPTTDTLGSISRSSPMIAGGLAGAALAAPYGAPFGPVGIALAGAGGAVLGGASASGLRQAMVQATNIATGRELASASEVTANINRDGMEQGEGYLLGAGVGAGAKMAGKAIKGAVADRLQSTIKQAFGAPEALTQYVQKRGTKAVFSPKNLNEGAALDNVRGATDDLAAARKAVGAAAGEAEDIALAKSGNKLPAVRHIREWLDKSLFGRGITDEKTASLARGKDTSILVKLRDVLTPTETVKKGVDAYGLETSERVTEKLTLRQALKAKRLVDEGLEFADKDFSKPTEALLKEANHKIREAVRADIGPAVGKLWDEFGAIADAQDKLAEFTGTRALSSVEQRAVQSLRGIMMKNPKEVENIIELVGAGLPGGKEQARTIFDSIAAQAFTKGGIGAPSSIPLKTAAAVGLTSDRAARTLVRGAEMVGKARIAPGAFQGAAAAGTPLMRDLLAPAPLSPAYQAVLDAANRR